MDVTDRGIIISKRLSQWENAPSPIEVKPPDKRKVSFATGLPAKASLPISFTLSGMIVLAQPRTRMSESFLIMALQLPGDSYLGLSLLTVILERASQS